MNRPVISHQQSPKGNRRDEGEHEMTPCIRGPEQEQERLPATDNRNPPNAVQSRNCGMRSFSTSNSSSTMSLISWSESAAAVSGS